MLLTRRLFSTNKTRKIPLSTNKFKEDFDKALISAKHIVDPYYKKYPEEAILLENYIKQHLNPSIIQKVKDAYVGKRQTFSGGNSILKMFLVICLALLFSIILVLDFQSTMIENLNTQKMSFYDKIHIPHIFPNIKTYVDKNLNEVVTLFDVVSVMRFCIKIPDRNVLDRIVDDALISAWVSPLMQDHLEELSKWGAGTVFRHYSYAPRYKIQKHELNYLSTHMMNNPEFIKLVGGVWDVIFLPPPNTPYDSRIKTI